MKLFFSSEIWVLKNLLKFDFYSFARSRFTSDSPEKKIEDNFSGPGKESEARTADAENDFLGGFTSWG